MLPSEFKQLIGAIRSLLEPWGSENRAIHDAIKEQNRTISESREASQRDQNAAALIIARAINNASDAASGYDKPYRDKEHGLQKVIVFLTFVTAVGALIAAAANWWTFNQVKKSTDAADRSARAAEYAANTASEQLRLMRQQLTYTQAAKLVIQAKFGSTDPAHFYDFNGVIFNDGHEDADEIKGTITLSEKSAVTGKIIEPQETADFAVQHPLIPMAANDPVPIPWQYGIEDRRVFNPFEKANILVSAAMKKRLENIASYLEVDIGASYLNGVETIPAKASFKGCFVYTFSAPGLISPCDNVSILLRESREAKRRVSEAQKHRK